MRKSLLAIATELVCLVAVPMTDVSAVSNRCLKFAEADTGIRSMTENEFAAYQDSGLLTKMKILTKSSDEKDFKYIYKRYSINNISKKCRASICSNLSFIHNPEYGDTVVNFENYQSLNFSYVEMMGVFEKAEAMVDIFGYEVGVFGSVETEMAVGLGYSSEISIGATLTLNSSFTAGEYFLWFEYYTIATVSVKYLVKNNKEYFCKAEFNSNSPLDYANARLIMKRPSYNFEEDAIC